MHGKKLFTLVCGLRLPLRIERVEFLNAMQQCLHLYYNGFSPERFHRISGGNFNRRAKKYWTRVNSSIDQMHRDFRANLMKQCTQRPASLFQGNERLGVGTTL